MEKIRILLAEDHVMVRSSMRAILEQQPDFEVIGEADDGQQALELAKSLQPDIVICDIRMPGVNGVVVAHRIKECSPGTKILMLSAYDDEDYVLELLKAGVSGYLLKTADLKQIIESIRIIHIGETVFHPAITAKLAAVTPRDRSGTGKLKDLSLRELEVLRLAAKGMTNRTIGVKLGLSVRTVEVHMASILSKLDVPTRVKAIEYFHKV